MPTDWVGYLRSAAQSAPGRLAYTFLADGETEGGHLTVGDLDLRARAIGAWLQSEGKQGERVLLLYPPGLEFISAFFGCLYAGATAVPAYPPRRNRNLGRLEAIARDSQAELALTTGATLKMVASQFEENACLSAVRWADTDALELDLAASWRDPQVTPESLAFLQYTSGSTSSPKGVMVSHGNLIHNERVIQAAMEHTEESTFVGWLPVYHDMGLIGNVLQPLFIGARCILMPPAAFLQRPVRWLQAISRYRGRTAGAPNFAYELCVRKTTAEERAGLDLSSWTVAYNGAEPIHHATLMAFAEAFAPYGFRREALYPCYGLAEATLLVSGVKKGADRLVQCVDGPALERHCAVVSSAEDPDSRALVSCGRPWLDQEIAIVDPETLRPCAPDRVGEIWVKGPSVARGYWNRPEESERTFRASLSTGASPYLRTGDLGFLRDGDLFVTGRLKDLVIIRGLNHYPQDLERTAEESHPGLRAGCGAAFSVEVGGEERLVVVQEVERQHRHADVRAAALAIRQAVAEVHDIQVYAVALVRPGSILKTSSGKIQRRACRAAFLDRTLDELGRHVFEDGVVDAGNDSSPRAADLAALEPAARRAALQLLLRQRLARALRVPVSEVGVDQPLSRLGIDSLRAAELKGELETEWGLAFPLEGFLTEKTLVELVEDVLSGKGAPLAPIAILPRGAALALSPEQERLFYLDQLQGGNPAHHIPLAYRLRGRCDASALCASLREVMARHETLRTRFEPTDAGPRQVIEAEVEPPFQLAELEQHQDALSSRMEEEVKRRFDLGRAPLLRVTLFRLGTDEHVLLLVLHHVVADLWSAGLLFEELFRVYRGMVEGGRPELPALPVQYADFASWRRAWPPAERLERSLGFWKNNLAGAAPVLTLPSARRRPAARTSGAGSHAFVVPADLAEAVDAVSRTRGVTPFVTLLAAFELLVHRHARVDEVVLGAPASGRLRPELEHLIGFFAYPLVLRTDLSGDPSGEQLLRRVQDVTLRALAHQDVPFAQVVEAARPARSAQHHPLVQVLFGYLDRAPEISLPGGLTVEPEAVGLAGTDFDLFMTLARDGQMLRGALEFSTDLFTPEAASALADGYLSLLRQIVRDPSRRLSAYELPADLVSDDSETQEHVIAISATFTAEPLADSLAFWMDTVALPCRLAFAPYNQVFQQLLDPDSLLSQNRGTNVVLFRPEDGIRARPEADLAEIDRNVVDLVAAFESASARSSTPHVLVICPSSPEFTAREGAPERLASWERGIREGLARLTGVHVITASELLETYPVGDHHDPYGDTNGHIPFRPSFFAALGTIVARRIAALRSAPRKVIVVDCDQTLWTGVCAEDGPEGVTIDAPRRALQELLRRQKDAGRLLCLCSKNDEEDVWAVFARRAEMPLRREDIVAWRVNWRPKSENLSSLATELGLGLESFVFLDDNPVEIAEVQGACPEVLALALPDAGKIVAFLKHVWPLDTPAVTAEDRKRTELYQANQQRERLRASLSLEDFLAGLGLEVAIAALETEHLPRAAQLTQRTNQFNATTRRRSEAAIRDYVASGGEAFAVQVRDRFGDYGLVGLVLFQASADALEVDTFLLSCRVLGRGVEHRMLAHLGALAQERRLTGVRVAFVSTPKNQPARDFLDGLLAGVRRASGEAETYEFSAAWAAALEYRPTTVAARSQEVSSGSDAPSATRAQGLTDAALVQRIALEWADPESVLATVRARKRQASAGRSTSAPYEPPRTPTEEEVVQIWAELLVLERVGIHDDFFDIGGHSLLATRMLSRIREVFEVELPLSVLFSEALTPAGLSRRIDEQVIESADPDEVAALLEELAGASGRELPAS